MLRYTYATKISLHQAVQSTSVKGSGSLSATVYGCTKRKLSSVKLRGAGVSETKSSA